MNIRKTFCALTICTIFAAETSAGAAEKTANCTISSGSKTVFNGKCIFTPEEGGSFYLSSPKQDGYLFDEIITVSVFVTEKGLAEVRGLTKNGNNSRWGEARRSRKDKSCWEGSDFRICAK